MPNQYINELLDLPELHVERIGSIQVHVDASPVADRQPCPLCGCTQAVKRNGRNKPRTIRHLSIFGKKCFVHIPVPRMACSHCHIHFVWTYAFVGPKEPYSRLFREQTVNQAMGSTATHSARMQDVPASTVLHMHQKALPTLNERLLEQA